MDANYVNFFTQQPGSMRADVGYTNLYVKNLDENITEETLQEKFSVFGNITSLVISRDCNGISKQFGFVNFEKPEDAKKAEESMHGAKLGSKVLYVARAQKKEERQKILQLQYRGLNLYVKHINDDVDEGVLKEYFSQCGTVNSVKIMRTQKGISRGFGFVCFSNRHEAERAIKVLNGVMFRGKPLYVAVAQTREERRQFFQLIATRRGASPGGLRGPLFNTCTNDSSSRYPIFHNRLFPMNPGFARQEAEMMNAHRIAHNHNIHPAYLQRAAGNRHH